MKITLPARHSFTICLVAVALISLREQAQAAGATWASTTSSDWDTSGNWSTPANFSNSNAFQASLGASTTSPSTITSITLSAATTANSITFNNESGTHSLSYTVGATGDAGLTLDGNSTGSSFTVIQDSSSATQTIGSDLTLVNSAASGKADAIDSSGGGTLALGTVSAGGTNAVGILFTNGLGTGSGGNITVGGAVSDATGAVNFTIKFNGGSTTLSQGVTATSLSFSNNGTVTGSGTVTIDGVVALGSAGAVSMSATGTLSLQGANTYGGKTSITGGTLTTELLANGGSASGIGESSNAAANLVIAGGTLQYTGAATSTDRLFQVGSTTAGSTSTLDASGTGAVVFTNAGALTYGTTGQTRTLALIGSNTGSNTLSSSITDNGIGGAVSVTKNGVGSWVLTGANTYSGGTTVSGGTLYANNGGGVGSGSSSTGTGAVSVAGGTLSGTGIMAPSGANGVTVNSTGTLMPGINSVSGSGVAAPGGSVIPITGTPGTLANGKLTLDATSFTGGGPGTPTGSLGGNTALLTLNSANLTFALGAANTSSALVIGGSTNNVVTFTGTSTVSINDLVGAQLTLNQEYTLIQGNGNTTYDTGSGSSLVLGATTSLGTQILGGLTLESDTAGNFFSQYYTTSQLYLVGDNIDIQVVPEPSTWAMIIGGIFALLFWQRRKQTR
jgi:fibronectin-binding autotransporter adhesin